MPEMKALDICIDVSHWQGAIDWAAVRAAGILIAMVKATEGASSTDPAFAFNRREAEKAGIAVIPYHFARPGNVDGQAKRFQSVAGLVQGSPFALDWEGDNTASPAEVEALGAQLAAIAGRPPLGYWGRPGAAPGGPTPAMLAWPRWVPRYPVSGARDWVSLPAATRGAVDRWWTVEGDASRRLFAQYTESGAVPGIAGPADRSVAFFDDADAALAWVRGVPVVDSVQPAETLGISPAKASKPPIPSTQSDPILAAMRAVQTGLAAAGLYHGAIDLDAGPATRQAMAEYRRQRGL